MRLGDGDEGFSTRRVGFPITISAGGGRDFIAGGLGDDALDGGAGADCGPGTDRKERAKLDPSDPRARSC